MRTNTTPASNTPPVIDSIDPISITANQMIQFTVSSFDPDGDDLQLIAENLPDGAVFDSATGAFTWTPSNSDVGEYRLEFLSLDSRGSGSTVEVTIQVTFDASESPVVGLWTFENGTATDLSTYGNDGVVQGATLNPSGGLRFDGLNDLVTIPNSNILQPQDAITLEVSVAPDGGNDIRDLVRFNSGSWPGYALSVKDGGASSSQGYYFYLTTETGLKTLFAPNLTWNGDWDDVIATFDGARNGGQAEIYVNGVLAASETNIGVRLVYPPHGSQQVTIGGRSDSENSFRGAISQVRITSAPFSSQLTASILTGGQLIDNDSFQFDDQERKTANLLPLKASHGENQPMPTSPSSTFDDLDAEMVFLFQEASPFNNPLTPQDTGLVDEFLTSDNFDFFQ